MPVREPIRQPATVETVPCGKARDPLDVVGRLNDLINCYVQAFAENALAFVGRVVLVIVLVAILIIAGYLFLKGG